MECFYKIILICKKKILICIIKKSKTTIYTNTLIEYITRNDLGGCTWRSYTSIFFLLAVIERQKSGLGSTKAQQS